MKNTKLFAAFILGIFLTALLLASVTKAQTRILYVPYYDGLSVRSGSNAFLPLVWNVTTHAMELGDSSGVQTFSSILSGGAGVGYYTRWARQNNRTAYVGNNTTGGVLALFDTLGSNVYRIFDTLGYRYISSVKPVKWLSRTKSAMTLDTFGQVTFDSAIKMTSVPNGTAASDSVVVWNTTSKQLGKIAPWAATMTTLTASGNSSATTFTLNIGAGKTSCIATSQNAAATVQSCSIAAATLTVTTTVAPATGVNNVKFTIIYQ